MIVSAWRYQSRRDSNLNIVRTEATIMERRLAVRKARSIAVS